MCVSAAFSSTICISVVSLSSNYYSIVLISSDYLSSVCLCKALFTTISCSIASYFLSLRAVLISFSFVLILKESPRKTCFLYIFLKLSCAVGFKIYDLFASLTIGYIFRVSSSLDVFSECELGSLAPYYSSIKLFLKIEFFIKLSLPRTPAFFIF